MSTNAKHAKRSPGPASRRCFIQPSSPRLSRPPREAPSRRHGIVPLSTRSSRTCLSFTRVHWTPEAFVLKCHELVGFDQSLSVYLGHVPDARTETAAGQNCLHVLLVCVAGRHRACGELSRKVRLLRQMLSCAASRASLRASARPSFSSNARRPSRCTSLWSWHRSVCRWCTKVGLDLPRPPRIGLSAGAQEALQLSPVERSGSASV